MGKQPRKPPRQTGPQMRKYRVSKQQSAGNELVGKILADLKAEGIEPDSRETELLEHDAAGYVIPFIPFWPATVRSGSPARLVLVR
jgi:hypothetical protein